MKRDARLLHSSLALLAAGAALGALACVPPGAPPESARGAALKECGPDGVIDDFEDNNNQISVIGDRGTLQPSLCNAVIVARAGSAFVRAWIAEGEREFDGTWSRHSCAAAAQLWARDPSALTVLPPHVLYRHPASRTGLAALVEADDPDLRGVASLHLWAHLWWSEQRRDFTAFHAGMITPQWIAKSATTYARIARRYLVP